MVIPQSRRGRDTRDWMEFKAVPLDRESGGVDHNPYIIPTYTPKP